MNADITEEKEYINNINTKQIKLTHNNIVGQMNYDLSSYYPCAKYGNICYGYNGVNPILYGKPDL